MKTDKNEKLILLRLKSGDKEEYSKIYYTYIDSIYRFIYFRVSNETVAEDLSQEVFLKFISMLNKDKIENIRSYLYKIARNLVVDYYRERTDKNETDIDTVAYKLIDEKQNIDINSEIADITNSLMKIKPEWRELIIMKHVDGLSHKEISEVIGKSGVYIRVNLHRAIKELKKILDK